MQRHQSPTTFFVYLFICCPSGPQVLEPPGDFFSSCAISFSLFGSVSFGDCDCARDLQVFTLLIFVSVIFVSLIFLNYFKRVLVLWYDRIRRVIRTSIVARAMSKENANSLNEVVK